jgi:putative transcriptional regulator
MNRSKVEKGSLLIASPDIEKGVYTRSVVLVCEHTSAGSFGLIINKPFNYELPIELQSIESINNPKLQLRIGGNMQPSQMMLLHSSPQNQDQTLKILDNVYLGGDVQFLGDILSHENSPDIFLCFGYTGWTIGELDKELAQNMWFPYPGSFELIFRSSPEKLWQSTLQQMGGKFSSLSSIPDDLSLN